MFEWQATRFWDEEIPDYQLSRISLRLRDKFPHNVREEETPHASRSPNEEDFNAKISSLDAINTGRRFVHEVGSSVSDTEIPEPVAGHGKTHALRTDREGLKKVDLMKEMAC